MTPDTYTLRKRLRQAQAFNTLLCWIVLVVAVAVALSLAGCAYTPPRPPEESTWISAECFGKVKHLTVAQYRIRPYCKQI